MSTTSSRAMQISQVTMTPEWASQILERNTHNRCVRHGMVRQITRDILCGRWLLTPQTVSIASDGRLIDGQHRLMAVVQAGEAVQMMLATDCPSECFTAIDIGQSRTPGDILKIEGVSNYTHVGSIIRLVHLYETCPGIVWVGQSATISKQEILEMYRADPDTWDAVTRLAVGFAKAPCVQISAVGAFLYLYQSAAAPSSDDEALSQDYLKLYSTGEMLSAGNPILALRNWQAVQWRVAQVKKPQTQLACHIKAYRYWKDAVQLKIFKQPHVPPMPQL